MVHFPDDGPDRLSPDAPAAPRPGTSSGARQRGVARQVAETFEFGRFVLDQERRALFLDGEPVALSSRAFDLLAVLLTERDRVVGRDELVNRVWGGLVVGQNNLAVQISALRAALAAEPGGDRLILTIPGRGYRFVGDAAVGRRVRPASPAHSLPAAPRAAAGAALASRKPPVAWWVAGLAFLATVCALVWHGLGVGRQEAPRFSIAVLPFHNLGGNPDQDHVADAVTDDVSTELSQIPGSVVIARESADMVKGSAAGAQAVGRALNVRYLLEGSLRADGALLHVDAKLIDAQTGIQLSPERFDVPREPISEAQKLIVSRISGGLASTLGQVEAARSLRDRPDDPDATDLFFRARSILDRDRTLPGFKAAQALLEQALRQQPGFGDALATLGWMLLRKNQVFQDPVEAKDYAEAKTMIARALRVAPRNTTALAAQGYLQLLEGDCQAALYSAQAALTIDMSNVKALEVEARCAQRDAKLDEADATLELLIRLDPQSSSTKARYLALADIHMLKEQYDYALDLIGHGTAGDPEPGPEDGSETMGHAEFARLLLIGVLQLKGDHQAAQRLQASYATIWPHRSAWRVACYFFKSQTAVPGFRKFEEALVAAGMPRYAHDDVAAPPASPTRSGADDTGDFSPVPHTVPGATTLDAATLHALITSGRKLVLIDLGPGEAVMVAAVWYGPDYASVPKVTFAVDTAARAAQGDPDMPVVVMADGLFGTASFEAAGKLVALGYRHVMWFRGGEEAWAQAGYPAKSPRM